MKQNKNIFQILGDFIEEKGYSWIIPHEKESLTDAGTNFFSLLLLIPIFGIVSVIRLIILIFKLFISLFYDINKDKSSDNSSVLDKNIAKTVVIGLLIVCLIVFPIRIIHKTAKNINVSLRYNRTSFTFEPNAIENSMPEDFSLRSAFDAINKSMRSDYTARDVVKLRKQLNMDDDFAQGLHFSSTDDFVIYLYSLKEIDKGVIPYINETDSLGEYMNLLDYYQQVALDEFEKGNYYNASDAVNHFFNIYNCQSVFPFTGVNNKMHLLKLLLQQRWELTINRKFAEEAFAGFGYSEFNQNSDDFDFDFADYLYLSDLCNDRPFLMNVNTYFEGLFQFHENNNISAMKYFESCYENTADTLLRQYCALMSIRAAFWNYDKLRNDQALDLYRETYANYAPDVTLKYFVPDLVKYQSVVLEIINNPQYTGY